VNANCMYCLRPFDAHTQLPTGDRGCADGKNTFNVEFQISPDAAAYVQANLDKSSADLAQGWIDQVRRKQRAEFEARTRAAPSNRRPSLSDAIESIGTFSTLAYCELTGAPDFHSKWVGSIEFCDYATGDVRTLVVDMVDHAMFEAWLTRNPSFCDADMRDHAREAVARMGSRSVKR
jgi:hypothetical protein